MPAKGWSHAKGQVGASGGNLTGENSLDELLVNYNSQSWERAEI